MAKIPLLIKGRIVDAQTNEPLYFANVRLANEQGQVVGTKGTNSKNDGSFLIMVDTTILPAPTSSGVNYFYEAPNIVASFVGYERQYVPVNFNLKDKSVTIPLMPKTLNTVVVTPNKTVEAAPDGSYVKHVKRTNWLALGALAILGIGVAAAVYHGTKSRK